MAGSAVIGSLRVNLGMDSAEFQTGARKAQGTLSTLGASIKAFAAGAVAALSMGAVTRALTSAIDRMDQLGKAAQKVGIPVEQLSALEYAARLADVSLGDLQGNLSKFNKALGEIAGGGDNKAATALKAIGVSALDAQGKLRPTIQIIADVAGKFQSYRDGAEKAALAQALFGKAGADMIPLLNGGAEAIREAERQANVFGLTVSQKAAGAAEQFNDNLTRMKAAGEGATQQMATALLPTLVDISNRFVDALEQGSGLTNWMSESLVVALKSVTEYVMTTAMEFRALAAIWQGLTTVVPFSELADHWKGVFDRIRADAEKTQEAIRKIWNPDTISGPGKGSTPATGSKPSAPILPGGGGGSSGKSNKIETASKAMLLLQQRTEAAAGSLYDRLIPGLEETNEVCADTAEEISSTLAGTFQSWISDAVDGTFKLRNALKGLLKSLTDIAMSAAFKILGNSFTNFLSGGTAGGSLYGFAKGGTIMPGGTGGMDSQLVMFRKSPNERVDISKPGQSLSHGGGDFKIYDQRGRGAPKIETGREADGTPYARIFDAMEKEFPGMLRRAAPGVLGMKPMDRRR